MIGAIIGTMIFLTVVTGAIIVNNKSKKCLYCGGKKHLKKFDMWMGETRYHHELCYKECLQHPDQYPDRCLFISMEIAKSRNFQEARRKGLEESCRQIADHEITKKEVSEIMESEDVLKKAFNLKESA